MKQSFAVIVHPPHSLLQIGHSFFITPLRAANIVVAQEGGKPQPGTNCMNGQRIRTTMLERELDAMTE
jgi:hypothetical protein